MEIRVFSDSRNIEKSFHGFGAKSGLTLTVRPLKELKKHLAEPRRGCFIYVDLSGYSAAEQKKIIQNLSRNTHHCYGFIDPKGTVNDVAELFHGGASDYVGKELYRQGISHKRIQKIMEFRKAELKDDVDFPDEVKACNYIISGSNWNNIKPGQEYTFCFMFIELDQKKASKKTFGDRAMNNPLEPFVNFIERNVGAVNGKIWMWNDYGGLILFPFDGKKIDAILTCFRMIMARKIFSIEESGFNALISYRIVLHLGNTIYQTKGETGTIVSDSINTIFHLVHKFAEPGYFYLTKEVFQFTPPALKNMFIPAGTFEGREIMRMRQPL